MDQQPRVHAGGKVLSQLKGSVGTITFNQPEKRNAMSVEMWAGLEEILAAWEPDPAVRVIILTGAGDKAFISGADISQFEKQRASADAQKEYDRLVRGGRQRLVEFPKPIIAQIRGFCLGGGLAIAMEADIRIAAADSQFGIPAAKMGIAYGFPYINRLNALIGPAHASMILFSGARIDAAEAWRIGLVNQIVPVDQLASTVDELATTIASNAPLSLAANKLILAQVLRDASERDMAAIERASAACMDSEDYREGRTAFLEKRSPRFRGS